MISFIENVGTGSAVRILLEPAEDGGTTRLLRKLTDTFTSETDGELLCETDRATSYLDVDVADGTIYYYACYEYDTASSSWSAGNGQGITSSASFSPAGTDPFESVYNRLVAGFQAEKTSGRIRSNTDVTVMMSPTSNDNTAYPYVVVKVADDKMLTTAIGNVIDVLTDDDEIAWYGEMTLKIVCVSNNAVQRQDMRRALRNIIQGNTQVFEYLGFVDVEFAQQDDDDAKQATRVYTNAAKLTYKYVVGVSKSADKIHAVTVRVSTQ